MSEWLPTWRDADSSVLESFSRIDLVVVDIDGTLLSAQGKESWARIAGLYRSLDLGRPRVRLTIATGRTLVGVKPVLHLMGLSGRTPVVLYNGSLVCRSDPYFPIHHRTIRHHVVRRLVEIAEACGGAALVYCVAADVEEGHLGPPDERVFGYTKALPRPHLDFNGMTITWLRSVDSLPDVSATSVLLEGCEPEAITAIEEVSSTRGSGRWTEVRPAGSDKAIGAGEAARVLGVRQQAVLALGDGNNDAELLRWAGIGVSVFGATHLAEGASDYRSREPVERAAIEVLYLVKEARRLLRQGRSTAGGRRGHDS